MTKKAFNNQEERETKFKADNFWVLAMEAMDNMVTPGEQRKKDLTEIFWYEIEQRIKKGELININLTGTVRTGKSTTAMAICWEIKRIIERYWKVQRPMGNKNIVRDQNEYSRLVKNRKEEYKHECDVIDEWAEMELAGYNATIEEKYLKDFSDRQAGRYYHRIACSPGNQTDSNADILLQTVPGSRSNGKTLLLLGYRTTSGISSQAVPIGHIVVDVKEVLAAPWYQEYLRKKEEKWELMNKHNVKSPRELEYADIILRTFERMKGVAAYGLNKRKHFKIPLFQEADKKGVWFSILGDKDVLETLEGMGETYQLIKEGEIKLEKMKHKYEEGAITEKQYNDFKEYQETITKNLESVIERETKLTMLWDEYQKIDEE